MIIHYILKLITDNLADGYEYIFVGWKQNLNEWIPDVYVPQHTTHNYIN